MSRPPLFAFSRPHAGKLRARPAHPLGWLLLFGVPLPGLILGTLAVPVVGKAGGAVVALAVAGLCVWMLFRLVVARGECVD